MCMNIEIASIIFEICIVPEPATTSGTGLLLGRDTGYESDDAYIQTRMSVSLRVQTFIISARHCCNFLVCDT